MNKTTTILLTALLAGCAPQPIPITKEEVSMFSDGQLCEIKNTYNPNMLIEAEVGKRKLICDPAINECMGRGNRLNTPAMALCVKELRQGWAMQEELARKDAQLQQQNQQQQIQKQNYETQKMILQHIENQRYMDNFWNNRRR